MERMKERKNDVENKELNALLNKDSHQTQEELVRSLEGSHS